MIDRGGGVLLKKVDSVAFCVVILLNNRKTKAMATNMSCSVTYGFFFYLWFFRSDFLFYLFVG